MGLRAALTLLLLLCLSVAGDNEEPVNVLDGGVASDDSTTTRSVKKSGEGNAVVDVSKPLWSQAACQEQLRAFECPADEAKDNNFVAVLCLITRGTTRQAAEEAAEDPSRAGSLSSKAVLPDECQHVIWDVFLFSLLCSVAILEIAFLNFSMITILCNLTLMKYT